MLIIFRVNFLRLFFFAKRWRLFFMKKDPVIIVIKNIILK